MVGAEDDVGDGGSVVDDPGNVVEVVVDGDVVVEDDVGEVDDVGDVVEVGEVGEVEKVGEVGEVEEVEEVGEVEDVDELVDELLVVVSTGCGLPTWAAPATSEVVMAGATHANPPAAMLA